MYKNLINPINSEIDSYNPPAQRSHAINTVGDAHRAIRDEIFRDLFRCVSDKMLCFEGAHKSLMELPYTPANMHALALAEDLYVKQMIDPFNPGNIGNLMARVVPPPFRTLAVGILVSNHGGSRHGLAGAFDKNNPFQKQAADRYLHETFGYT